MKAILQNWENVKLEQLFPLATRRYVPHCVKVLEDSRAFDVFALPREDWIAGTDTYLRDSQSKPNSQPINSSLESH
jgi:hypothetical protein